MEFDSSTGGGLGLRPNAFQPGPEKYRTPVPSSVRRKQAIFPHHVRRYAKDCVSTEQGNEPKAFSREKLSLLGCTTVLEGDRAFVEARQTSTPYTPFNRKTERPAPAEDVSSTAVFS